MIIKIKDKTQPAVPNNMLAFARFVDCVLCEAICNPNSEISDANRRAATARIIEFPTNMGKINDAIKIIHETPAKNNGFTLTWRFETRRFLASYPGINASPKAWHSPVD